MSTLGLRHLRVLLLPMLLMQVGALTWAWSDRQSTAAPQMSPPDSQMPLAQQRVVQAQQMLSKLRQMPSSDQRADVSNYLNTRARTAPLPVAAAASTPSNATDYAALNPGVIRHGRTWKLILGEEVYAAGSALPGGDRLIKVATDHFVVVSPVSGRLRIPIAAG